MHTLKRPKHRWDDNIRSGLREIWWEGVDWIYLSQDRDQWLAIVHMVINLWFCKRWEFLD